MYSEFTLEGKGIAELDTEVRFYVALARQEGSELIKLLVPESDNARDNDRRFNCLIKIVRSMMKSDLIQFFVTDDDFKAATTEAEFLLNKYSSYINRDESIQARLFIKL